MLLGIDCSRAQSEWRERNMRTKHAMNHIIWQTKLRNNFYYISVTCAQQRTHRKKRALHTMGHGQICASSGLVGCRETPKAQRNTTDNKNPKRGKVFLWTLSWFGMGTADDSTHEANSRPFEARLSRRESDFYSSVDGLLPAQHGNVFIEIETQKKSHQQTRVSRVENRDFV